MAPSSQQVYYHRDAAFLFTVLTNANIVSNTANVKISNFPFAQFNVHGRLRDFVVVPERRVRIEVRIHSFVDENAVLSDLKNEITVTKHSSTWPLATTNLDGGMKLGAPRLLDAMLRPQFLLVSARSVENNGIVSFGLVRRKLQSIF